MTCKREAPIKAALPPTGAHNDTMGTKPGTQASSGGHAGGFRKVWSPEERRVGALPRRGRCGAEGERTVALP